MQDVGRVSLALDIWRLAWPAIVRNMLNCASDRVTLAFVGHFDPDTTHYDGAGLGKMYSNITGLSIGLGACLGLGTLCSQAHGAGKSQLLNGLYLRRCAVVLCVAFVYSATAALFCERALVAVSQPPAVARCSAYYAQVQLIGVPFFWAASAVQTVCDGLQDTKPGMYAGLISAGMQVVLCAVATHPAALGMGYLGMAAARSAGGIVQLVTIIAIVILQGRQAQVWGRPPPQPATGSPEDASGAAMQRGAGTADERVLSCSGLTQFLCVAWPGALMMWLEWWSFEGLTVLVGWLPDSVTLLAAHGTMFNILVVFYMAFTGLNSALCASIGKHIGAGTAGATAPKLIRIALALAVGFAALITTATYLLRVPIAALFDSDRVVRTAIEQNILGAALSVPGYGVLMTLYGACLGANRQRPAFLGTLLGYATGVPLAWLLGCHLHWPRPLLGIWLGNVWALGFAASWVLVLVLGCIPWGHVRAVAGESGSRSESLLANAYGHVDGDEARTAAEPVGAINVRGLASDR